jgi:hypothetical protein
MKRSPPISASPSGSNPSRIIPLTFVLEGGNKAATEWKPISPNARVTISS